MATKVKNDDFGVQAIGVSTLNIKQLKANPHNPRKLFDREDMTVLANSIKRVGILVPLTVYRESATRQYVILDGQRRWMCAQEVGLKEVPVNEVKEPSLVQNIVTMFQIHRLRKDWELMPTALKLELLMTELEERSEKRLANLTGLDEAVVVRCKKLLSYPKRYQNMMLDVDPNKREKADFFIELYPVRTDREVNKFQWFDRNEFTDAMIEKYEQKGIKSVTEFRVVKQYINNAVKARKQRMLSIKLREFQNKPALTPDHLNIESAEITANAKKILKSVNSLYTQVDGLDINDYYGEEALWGRLEEFVNLVQKKLKTLGRRKGD